MTTNAVSELPSGPVSRPDARLWVELRVKELAKRLATKLEVQASRVAAEQSHLEGYAASQLHAGNREAAEEWLERAAECAAAAHTLRQIAMNPAKFRSIVKELGQGGGRV